MALLNPDELSTALAGLDGWRRIDSELVAVVEAPSFQAAVALVVRIAFEAESMNHHPDIAVNYRRVTLRLSTHSEGGITTKDVTLAHVVQAIVNEGCRFESGG